MRTTYKFSNGELYDEMLDFLGKPIPCEKCLVRSTCYSWKKENHELLITLEDTCRKAKDWLRDFKSLDSDLIDIGIKISVQDIIKIIDHWEEGSEKLKKRIRLPISSIERIGKYINELDPKYCHPRKSNYGVLVLNKIINEALDILKKREIS